MRRKDMYNYVDFCGAHWLDPDKLMVDK